MEAAVKTVEEEVVGFIDIGTNAVRLLVVRIKLNYSYTIISQEKEVVRLGEQEFEDNTLKEDAMERAIFVCGKFVDLARTYGAHNVVAVATSATREARNQTEFLENLKRQTGLEVRVISGQEEARLIWLGVSSGIDIGDQKALFIDLGGGSTEVAIANQHEIFYVDSLKLGAIRLTGQFVGEGWTGPIKIETYKWMKRYACEKLEAITPKVLEYGVRLAFGSSGTMINLAEVSNKLFRKDSTDDLVLTRKNLKKIATVLCWLPLEERRKVPAINPDRADIIVAGAAIIEAEMEQFGLEEIHVSHRELRDGLLVDYLSKIQGFKQLQQTPARSRSVLHLGRACNFDEKHAGVVTALALDLFNSAKQIGLHSMNEKDREMLRYASTLHDVGDFISFNDHHMHSYYIINNAGLLGFSRQEIRIMANIARFHRKKLPSKKALRTEDIDEESKEKVLVLSTFLRLAEKLDRSHCGLVKKAEFTLENNDHVLLKFYSDRDCSMEKWSILQNRQAFSEAFDMELDAACVTAPGTHRQ
jgi:exopolyphosphatase / guanosine-5'-triphosphate,3'-diphosphate pyrophosphatase